MAFWRREPLHERLAREGGLAPQPPPAHEPGPHWGEVGIHGIHRLREWDAVATTRVDLPGDAVSYVALPDGMLLVEEGADEVDPTPLADALETKIDPPYRAEGVRRERDVWAVGARRIDVVALAEDPAGDSIELVWDGHERRLRLDGEPSLGRVPELEALAAARFGTYVVAATRLDGLLWEAEVTPL
jgi:hypothetical protein